MTPLSVDEHGIPRLLAATNAPLLPNPTATATALAHVRRLAPSWGAHVPELVGVGEVEMPGGTIVRLRQLLDSVPVDDGELHVFVRADGGLVGVSGSMVDAAAERTAPSYRDDDAAAIARAIRANYHVAFDPHALAALKRADKLRVLAGRSGSITVAAANAQKVWSRIGNGLTAAWAIDIDASSGKSTTADGFHTVLGADGRVLAQRSLIANDFNYRVFADTTGERHPFDGPTADPTPNVGGVTAPYPGFVSPNLVTVGGLDHLNDPWLPTAATESNGNNVDAYTDVNAPDGFSAGDLRATTTSAGTFDRVYDLSAAPLSSQDQQRAAVTALFYTVNWLHDFWYDHGFTEATGNAQASNYGRGGVEGDAMHAEAEDDANGTGINNANMMTPVDGMSPRLQVYVWSGAQDVLISYAANTPAGGVAVFGPSSFNLTAVAALAVPANGCTALTNNVSGTIVVVDRGTCTFKTKTLNAMNAGAVGVILVDNNPANTAPPALGDDTTITTAITIGTLSVTLVAGTTLKTTIGNGATTVTMHRIPGAEHDGDLDASVLAHEYGHYLHHRLSNCGAALCGAMSEGWGDFDALMFVLRSGDNLDGAFPLAIYSTVADFESPYFGIRRAPYSVDPTVNGLSFRHMALGEALPTGQPFIVLGGNNEVHNAGEIWAETLWEAYIALQKAGTSYTTTRANMAAYVVGGLLMTPTDTTPTETRDAILLAASAASTTDAATISQAFARRGMGSCAISPDRDSTTFTGIVESTDVKGRLFAAAITSSDSITTCDEDGVLDATEAGRIYIPVSNVGQAAMTNLSIAVTTTTPGVTITSAPMTAATFAVGHTMYATADVKVDDTLTAPTEGDFTVTITAEGGCDAAITQPVAIRLNVDDVAASSATDTFDVPASVWSASSANWDHIRVTALDGAWRGADQDSPSDVRLTSPVLHASATANVTMTFTHTYDFEATFDGGVIEISTDNGQTWVDVATYTGIAPGYTNTLDVAGGNALAGRMVFSGTNPATPAPDTVALDFGTQLAGQTFKVRFRVGTDQAVGATGWTIDNVAFTGLDNTPFPTQVADTHSCTVSTSPTDAGITSSDAGTLPGIPVDGGCCDAGPLRTGNLMIAFGVLALIRRRRRG